LFFSFKEKKAHKVRAKVVATIGTIDHDFALPNPDVCQQLGCPLKNGAPYVYHNSMYVSPTYPSVCKIKSFFSYKFYAISMNVCVGKSQSNALLFDRW